MKYFDLLRKIYTEGEPIVTRNNYVKELFYVPLEIPAGQNLYCWGEHRTLDMVKKYLLKELAWYLSGDRNSGFIAEQAKLWDEIKNPDGTLNSNYGHLVFYNRTEHPSLPGVTMTPFMWALYCLSADINTRRAVVTYNTGGFNYPANKDFICTQHQAFFVRRGRLECCVALRSSDAIWGLQYNIPWWSTVQQILFSYLKKKYPALCLGGIRVQIYSAHVYERHFKLVEKLSNAPQETYFMRFKTAPQIGRTARELEEFLAKNLAFEKLF